MAVGALERADEGALLLPALPDHGLILVVLGVGEVVLALRFGFCGCSAHLSSSFEDGCVFKLASGLRGVKERPPSPRLACTSPAKGGGRPPKAENFVFLIEACVNGGRAQVGAG